MRSFSVLLALACVAIATPAPLPNDSGTPQTPLQAGLMTSYPGFHLDLNALRLVQIEDKPPVWMTELEKVSSCCLAFGRS